MPADSGNFPEIPLSLRSCGELNPRHMDPLLKLLSTDASLAPQEMAAILGISEQDVRSRVRELSADHVVLGYRAVLNEEKLGREMVRALIEVRITPERGGGFDKLAERIAKYCEVRSCHLMSGGYDLLVEVEGATLREVASFVSEKLSTLQGVLSTATHFVLRAYKEQGVLMKREAPEERLSVAP
jgi:DNA-binding Lrp family transcriptional regulator